jgi:hypothetical protein
MNETSDSLDLQLLQQRLRQMSDSELIRFGEAASVCSANGGKSARETIKVQLEETRAEWKRRHPITG